jgi:hypothetical protein
LLLDEDDFVLHLERAIRVLDTVMYNPRNVIFEDAPNGFYDVTELKIDEINTVYYSIESADSMLGGLDLGVGVLPILSAQMMPLSSLDGLVDYLALKNVLNMLQRKMLSTTDYQLFPVNAEGKQLLQIRNPGNLFWVEYLPYLPFDADSWDLFENEFQFVSDLAFMHVCHANVEMQAQASILGVGKEAVNLVTYWDNKIKEHIKAWEDSSVITYIS